MVNLVLTLVGGFLGAFLGVLAAVHLAARAQELGRPILKSLPGMSTAKGKIYYSDEHVPDEETKERVSVNA